MVKIKSILLPLAVVGFNLLTWAAVLPQAQQSANSHMNNGPVVGTLYFILATGCAVLAGLSFVRHRAYGRAGLYLLLNGSLIYWGLRLLTLYCEGCATSG